MQGDRGPRGTGVQGFYACAVSARDGEVERGMGGKGEGVMDKKTLLDAMDRIEALLAEADKKAEYLCGVLVQTNLVKEIGSSRDIQHEINNARAIASAVKVLADV